MLLEPVKGYADMSKVLFFARDPGGANCIIPVIKKMPGNIKMSVMAKDIAYNRIKSRGASVEDIHSKCDPNSIGSIKNFLRNDSVELVVTGTSVDDYTERYLWKACSLLGIPSIAILDQWTNTGIRFSKYDYLHEEEYNTVRSFEYLPTIICVMDEVAKRMIVKEGIQDGLIRITGQPHFDTVKSEFEKTECINMEGKTITFVSEPIFCDYNNYGQEDYWGFDEFSVFSELVNAIKGVKEKCDNTVGIIVRPHPREDVDEWKHRIDHIQGIKVCIDSKSSTYQLLRRSNLVCGMSSMMLLEAAICGVPVMSIMIGLKRDNPFVLNNLGICHSVMSREELKKNIELFWNGHIEEQSGFSYIENATDNVIRCINEVLKNGKTCN